MRMQHREAERRKKMFSSSLTTTPNPPPLRAHTFFSVAAWGVTWVN